MNKLWKRLARHQQCASQQTAGHQGHQFAEGHTADNLAENLLRIAREWNITDKIVACVTDNAHNISLAIHKTP